VQGRDIFKWPLSDKKLLYTDLQRLGVQKYRATEFCALAPDICGSSVWNLLCVFFLVLRILRWRLYFREICGPLSTVVVNNELQMCGRKRPLCEAIFWNVPGGTTGKHLCIFRTPAKNFTGQKYESEFSLEPSCPMVCVWFLVSFNKTCQRRTLRSAG
jgi:hypothetical protein